MPKAKYEGIYRSIKKRIEAQDYPYQSLLPSENTLIEEYACSRNTVRRAIAELIADGYVQSMQGRGVRVIYQPVGKTTFTIGGIETFQETANRNRLHAVTRVIRFETIIATEQFAAESGFSEGDELWAVQRVRYLDGKALILDINYFLKEFVPGLTEEIASHSIYDFIENVLGMQIITGTGSTMVVFDDETLASKVQALSGKKVMDIATRKVVAATPDQHVGEVARILAKKQFKKLPVVDADGRLVGVIRRKSVMEHAFDVLFPKDDR
mgnify:CR=1 FL=1